MGHHSLSIQGGPICTCAQSTSQWHVLGRSCARGWCTELNASGHPHSRRCFKPNKLLRLGLPALTLGVHVGGLAGNSGLGHAHRHRARLLALGAPEACSAHGVASSAGRVHRRQRVACSCGTAQQGHRCSRGGGRPHVSFTPSMQHHQAALTCILVIVCNHVWHGVLRGRGLPE